MSYRQKLRLLLTFYSSYFLPSILISVTGGLIIALAGFKIIAAMIWFKAITTAVIIGYINNYKRKELYYYHNLGLSKNVLWIYTMGVDFLLFISMVITIFHFDIRLILN